MSTSPHSRRRCLRAAPAAALALVLLATLPAAAGPTERLREFFAAVNAVLGDPETEDNPIERVSRLRRLVADVSAVDEAAAVALGRQWLARSPGEREEFVALFAELLERAYVGRLAGRSRVSNGVRIVYLDESVAGDEATVRTALGAKDGGEARVDYRMVNREGRWRVRDLVLDGISTVENYRAQFRHLLSRVSYGDLVGMLKAKLGEESIMFARVEGPSAAAPAPSPAAPLQIAERDAPVTGGDLEPPVADIAPSPPALRSREIGWVVDAAPTGSYWIQVGAFKSADAAGRLLERLGEAMIVSSAGGHLLLVRVGPFAGHAQALSRLRELQAIGYHPFIAEARD